jgi:hypothetical protein
VKDYHIPPERSTQRFFRKPLSWRVVTKMPPKKTEKIPPPVVTFWEVRHENSAVTPSCRRQGARG